MPDFGILSDKLNAFEAMPNILLPAAFLEGESRNIFEQDGEYKSLRGRQDALGDSDGLNIAMPTAVFAIARDGVAAGRRDSNAGKPGAPIQAFPMSE